MGKGKGRGRRRAGWSTGQQEIVNRLFVYGTLRTGQPARSLIANHVVHSEPASARGRMYAMPDGYPGFVPGDQGTVVGDVVTISELAAAFALLDAYEGSDFVRSMHQIQLGDGTDVWTWCYLLRDPSQAASADPIPSGDWRHFLSGA